MKIFNRFMAVIVSFLMITNVLYAQEVSIVPGSTLSQPAISLEEAVEDDIQADTDTDVSDDAPDLLNETSPLSEADDVEASDSNPGVSDLDINSHILGIEEGDTVSGTVSIRPNLEALPDIRKVAYYLNETKSGKVYASPFIWGGPTGDGTVAFDTHQLPNGNYTLNMIYTTSAGDQPCLLINFIVHNTTTPPVTPPRPTVCRPKPPKHHKHHKKHHVCKVEKKVIHHKKTNSKCAIKKLVHKSKTTHCKPAKKIIHKPVSKCATKVVHKPAPKAAPKCAAKRHRS